MKRLNVIRLVLHLIGSRFYVSHAVLYSKVDVGLLAVDFSDIPARVSDINLCLNQISSLDAFPDFSLLVYLDVRYNLLTVFPDLATVADTLTELYLSNNPIEVIDPVRLQILTRLQHLGVANARLTSFPDMSPVGGSSLLYLVLGTNQLGVFPFLPVIGAKLIDLRLGGNFMDVPPREVLEIYPKLELWNLMNATIDKLPDLRAFQKGNKAFAISFRNNLIKTLDKYVLTYLDTSLWTLTLDTNRVSTVPNMMWASVDAQITLADNPIVCDCHLRWLKTASTGIDQTSMVCQHPPQHNGTHLASLSFEDLNCDGPTRETQISTFDPAASSKSQPPIGHVVSVRSHFECATRCVNDDACLIFAFRITPDGPECALTDALDMANAVMGAPSGEWGNNDVRWYLTDS